MLEIRFLLSDFISPVPPHRSESSKASDSYLYLRENGNEDAPVVKVRRVKPLSFCQFSSRDLFVNPLEGVFTLKVGTFHFHICPFSQTLNRSLSGWIPPTIGSITLP